MNKLDQLLDKHFPVTRQMDHTDEEINKIQRQAFTEGYNAAVAQIRIENPTLTLTQAEHFAAKKF